MILQNSAYLVLSFIPLSMQSFGEIAAPLPSLLRKGQPFLWTDAEQQSFDNLKRMLINPVCLKYPEPGSPYVLYTDASNVGLGTVLTQTEKNSGQERPICFISRKLQGAEVNYATVEKELLAVIYALKKLRKYLLGNDFLLCTDNSAVRYLFMKSEANSRLQRWVMAVQEFRFQVKHVAGKSNVVADVLSRYPLQEEQDDNNDDPLENFYPVWLRFQVKHVAGKSNVVADVLSRYPL
jgi:ribonuclease HI